MDFDQPRFETLRRAATGDRGDDANDAPIVIGAAPFGEARRFEPIDEARDVGDWSDEAISDLLAGEACAPRSGQDAERVVLRFREPLLFEESADLGAEDSRGPAKSEIELFLGGFEWAATLNLFLEGRRHGAPFARVEVGVGKSRAPLLRRVRGNLPVATGKMTKARPARGFRAGRALEVGDVRRSCFRGTRSSSRSRAKGYPPCSPPCSPGG